MSEENKKNTSKIFEKIITYVLLGVVGAGLFVLGFYTKTWTQSETMQELEYVIKIIEENYVGEFDKDEFISAAVNGSLDRYSAYYNIDQYNQVQVDKQGISSGRIGVSFYSGSTVIASVSGNSPAERAGVTEGGELTGVKLVGDDEFIEVEEYKTFETFLSEREKNEAFEISVSYAGEQEIYSLAKEDYIESYVWYQDASGGSNLVLNEGVWEIQSSKKRLKTRITEGYAYIKLSSFNGSAATQFAVALEEMKTCNLKKLVLDLRSNGGGYMDVLTNITGYLIPGKDKQLVSLAEYKSGKTYGFYTSKNSYDDYGYEKITVLANSGTASASEALIGAMLDYDKSAEKNIVSVIVSDNGVKNTTYGKGIMQTTFSYNKGSAIKLTTAKIYWPVSRTCIHDTGITASTDERVSTVKTSATKDAELLFAMGVN